MSSPPIVGADVDIVQGEQQQGAAAGSAPWRLVVSGTGERHGRRGPYRVQRCLGDPMMGRGLRFHFLKIPSPVLVGGWRRGGRRKDDDLDAARTIKRADGGVVMFFLSPRRVANGRGGRGGWLVAWVVLVCGTGLSFAIEDHQPTKYGPLPGWGPSPPSPPDSTVEGGARGGWRGEGWVIESRQGGRRLVRNVLSSTVVWPRGPVGFWICGREFSMAKISIFFWFGMRSHRERPLIGWVLRRHTTFLHSGVRERRGKKKVALVLINQYTQAGAHNRYEDCKVYASRKLLLIIEQLDDRSELNQAGHSSSSRSSAQLVIMSGTPRASHRLPSNRNFEAASQSRENSQLSLHRKAARRSPISAAATSAPIDHPPVTSHTTPLAETQLGISSKCASAAADLHACYPSAVRSPNLRQRDLGLGRVAALER
ncbi:hypothetical protein EDB87DRAFT_1577970 [Lactarius vividus]|nr:hypothetical protein EDB87DRAFT_1577970 [Lactarius vividus]